MLNKLLEKFGKKKLFIIEAISLVFGFLSTYILSYLTSKYAKEKGRTKLSSFIKYIGVIDVFLTGLIYIIYPEGGKIFFVVSMYIASVLCNVVLIVIQNYLYKCESIDTNSPEQIAKKNRSLKIFLISALVGIVVAIGFIFGVLAVIDMLQVEDTNGPDNYELETMDDTDFLEENREFYGPLTFDVTSNEKSGADDAERDYSGVVFSAERTTGTVLIQATRGLTDTLVLNIDSKVSSGNCELVVMCGDEIYQRVKVNSKQTIVIEDAKDKYYHVVVGAESGVMEINVTREFK